MSNWLEALTEIAEDFEVSDVVGFKFSRIDGVIKCWVTVREDKKLTTWRLVDDGVSNGMMEWEKVPDQLEDRTRNYIERFGPKVGRSYSEGLLSTLGSELLSCDEVGLRYKGDEE